MAEGEVACPALIEVTVPDLAAAVERLTAAGCEVLGGMGGERVRVGDLTIALRGA
ncbi:hypothetical protein [Mycolicibacterium fallax]|uniref:hypothetical protein n=1 Tax=Mycolicibacterium fallax TaxID=1793 RepID=UPI00138C9AA6|nr:hypothetical protein [Mycolicibacterium fallax]BBY97871.1 hypothetical protein MFAL_13380 [Mycolicibacterium fallax]